MKLTQKDNYTLVEVTETTFDDFITTFDHNFEELSNNNLVLQISPENNFTEKNILLFLKYADIQRENGMSFVVICTDVEVDNFPEDFNIVPTLIEAEDIIEMEDIQRDLGF